MCCSCWLSIVIWSRNLNKIYTFSSSFIIASDQLCNSEGCFVPASLCILEPLGSQHDWSWKKLLKVHIMIGLYHVKSFQDKQSNNQQSVIIMHCDCCDRQESGIICLVWVVITFYCTLKVDKSTGTSGDVFDLGTEAAPFQMHPGKAPRKGLSWLKCLPQKFLRKKKAAENVSKSTCVVDFSPDFISQMSQMYHIFLVYFPFQVFRGWYL